MSLRTAVYDAVVEDPTLSGLGLTHDSVFANWVPDSPAATLKRWVILRWGITDPGIGPVSRGTLHVWAYDRDRHYGFICDALKRIREILDGLPTEATGDGHVVNVEWAAATEDNWDVEYAAVSRGETYIITASGI